MGTLTAEALPLIGAVRVVLDVTDFADVGDGECQLLRSTASPADLTEFYAAAVRVRIRPTYDLDTVFPSLGYPWEMTAGGTDVWYDTEAPIGVPVWYQIELPGADDAFIETAAPVTLTVGAAAGWLSDPQAPAGDVRLDLLPSDDCVTPEGVIFVSNGSDSTASAGARFDVIDQAAPSIVTGRRKLPTSTLTVAALTFADRDRVHELLATGNVLMLRLVSQYGLTDRYLDVGDVATNALSPDLRLPYRVLDMPYQLVTAPAEPAAGVLGTRFGDLDQYATWAAFDAAALTSIDLLLGDGSTVGLGA